MSTEYPGEVPRVIALAQLDEQGGIRRFDYRGDGGVRPGPYLCGDRSFPCGFGADV
jgi:hypothetical protein